MDKYVTSTVVPDFNSVPGRAELSRNIWNAIQKARGSTLCVYGPQGSGKTYILEKILGKNYTENFVMEKSRSHTHTVVDNPTSDVIMFLKTHGSFSLGTTIIVCDNIKKVDFCDCIEVPCFTEAQLNAVFPGHPDAARKCLGNMWNFEFYKQFSDSKDQFWTPRDYVKRIMSVRLDSYIKSTVEEHGHTLGMIHENYTDSPGLTLDECDDIIDSISLADVYDDLLYTQDWNYCKFFQIEGIARPATVIAGRHTGELRPGSCWTKMNNHKMRMSRLKRFKPLCHQKLILILDQLMKDPTNNPYNLESCDVDTINHLKMTNKFRPAEVARLKKFLSSSRATASQAKHKQTK